MTFCEMLSQPFACQQHFSRTRTNTQQILPELIWKHLLIEEFSLHLFRLFFHAPFFIVLPNSMIGNIRWKLILNTQGMTQTRKDFEWLQRILDSLQYFLSWKGVPIVSLINLQWLTQPKQTRQPKKAYYNHYFVDREWKCRPSKLCKCFTLSCRNKQALNFFDKLTHWFRQDLFASRFPKKPEQRSPQSKSHAPSCCCFCSLD